MYTRRPQPPLSVGRVVRTILGTATAVLLVMGFVVRDDPRWLVAAGTCGLIWWGWDLLMEYVFTPIGEWITGAFMGGSIGALPPQARPNLDEVTRLLEGYLRKRASRKVEINAAIRLEEIYRTVKQDPGRARAVIRLVRARYPDAPELERYAVERDFEELDFDALEAELEAEQGRQGENSETGGAVG
jgi:hypothetical protein